MENNSLMYMYICINVRKIMCTVYTYEFKNYCKCQKVE